ncbi:MAG: hypothetical protein U9N38_04930, partial [Thermodesulfobacteriota bacterium]|nr:hypothetical protein [Thermodesulfobacteriota bacterium]
RYRLKRFFRLSAMNLDAEKKRYWKKDAKTTKPEFSQSILQETLDLSGATCSKLGDYFGGVSGAAITVRYNKIAKEMAEDKRLKRKVEKIKTRIVNI